MASTDVRFFVDDKIFTGWDSVSVHRNIDSLCGSFSLSFYDRWGNDASQWPMLPNKPVKIYLGEHRVLTGYIDDLSARYDATQTSMDIHGRDKAGDLVDSDTPPREFKNLKIDRIAEFILEPYGIQLEVNADLGEKFRKFSVKVGDTPFECFQRMAKERGVFFVSDEFGFVSIQKRGSGKSDGRLVHGKNILDASIKYDNANRFSDYYVVGQGAGRSTFYGDDTVRSKGRARDLGMPRHRPLYLMAEGNASIRSVQNRANWEMSVRIARAIQVTVVVQGWTTPNGNLWKVNELVDLIDPKLGIDGEMLISGLTFTKDGDGSKTTLELVKREAFLPEPVVIKENKASVSRYEDDIALSQI